MIDVDAAEKAAHEACPCLGDTACTADCENVRCTCDGGPAECDWPGHAAIRRLESAARLAGKLEQADDALVAVYTDCGHICEAAQTIREVRDRLRREAAAQAGASDGK